MKNADSSRMITLDDVLGTRIRVPFKGTAEQYAKLIAGERKFVALKRRCLKQAAQCVTGADKIQAVDNYMLMLGSHERIAALLPLIEREPPEIFWSIFVRWWSDCDCTWRWNARLVKILQRVGPCRHYRELDGRRRHWHGLDKFFERLPDRLTVYRGASRSHIKGALSWTTDLDIARDFAYGHGGLAVPNAVIATGAVHKDELFLASDDRSEREILALPRIVKVRDFSAAEFARIKQARADAKWADEAADEHAKAQARFDEDDALQLLEY
jgi:hypothetical protein